MWSLLSPPSRGRKAHKVERTERKVGATECFAAGPLGTETAEQTKFFCWVRQREFKWKDCFPQGSTLEEGMEG